MAVFLSKFLPLFVYPTGLACLLLAAALVLHRRKRTWITLVALALCVLFLGGNRWVAVSLVRSLEWRYLPTDPGPAPVMVVLGGGTEAPLPPRTFPEVNSAGDRVIYAARLYQQGKAPRILLSGGSILWLGTAATTPAEDMAALLNLMGVPQSALWLQGHSQNTAEDASFSAEMLRSAGVTRIILVTSAMHMPRAAALFKAQGFQVEPAPCDYSVTEADWHDLWQPNLPAFLVNLVPTGSNLRATSSAMKEYIGMAVAGLGSGDSAE